MKTLWLILSVGGFLAPAYWLWKVTFVEGNVLFWTDPTATTMATFANDYTTAFVVDLFYVVAMFFIFSWHEARRLEIKNVWVVWVLTLLFGVAGPFPLFMYMREKARE
jgi:hypothetical protein